MSIPSASSILAAAAKGWFERALNTVLGFLAENWLWVGLGVFVVVFLIACAIWVRPSRS